MISRIDHVSIAVSDYEGAFRFFSTLLGAIPGARAEDPNMKYIWQLFSLGDLSRLELMKATGRGSFLDNFLDSRGSGVHHITMETPDIEAARATLERHNIPYFGFASLGDRWKELFIHPKDAFGILVQIAEFEPDDWLDESVKLPADQSFSVSGSADGCVIDLAHPGGGKVSIHLTADKTKRLISELQKALDQGNKGSM